MREYCQNFNKTPRKRNSTFSPYKNGKANLNTAKFNRNSDFRSQNERTKSCKHQIIDFFTPLLFSKETQTKTRRNVRRGEELTMEINRFYLMYVFKAKGRLEERERRNQGFWRGQRKREGNGEYIIVVVVLCSSDFLSPPIKKLKA